MSQKQIKVNTQMQHNKNKSMYEVSEAHSYYTKKNMKIKNKKKMYVMLYQTFPTHPLILPIEPNNSTHPIQK